MTSNERFVEAKNKVVLGESLILGVGCLSEKTVHAAIKLFIEPDTSFHERNVIGRMVADVYNEAGIFEIQTANFGYMTKKLEKFLEIDNVTIVYPSVASKNIIWVDRNGNISGNSRSPKKGSFADLFYELYNIRSFLSDPRLRIMMLSIDVDEYRILDGRGKDKKSRATKFDRIPKELVGEYIFTKPEDYLSVLPEMPETFTLKDLAKAMKTDRTKAYGTVSVLISLGAAEFYEKKSRTNYYRIKKPM